jgi:diacylglycerol O-acyltransferase
MVECHPLVPLSSNQTLSIALFSYSGALYWGINAERHLFPELKGFIRALDESFHELCGAAESSQ